MADAEDLAPSHGELEHELITTALEIEEIDQNLYRSKSGLWLPSDGRGVFGGYVEAIQILRFTVMGLIAIPATPQSPYKTVVLIRQGHAPQSKLRRFSFSDKDFWARFFFQFPLSSQLSH